MSGGKSKLPEEELEVRQDENDHDEEGEGEEEEEGDKDNDSAALASAAGASSSSAVSRPIVGASGREDCVFGGLPGDPPSTEARTGPPWAMAGDTQGMRRPGDVADLEP